MSESGFSIFNMFMLCLRIHTRMSGRSTKKKHTIIALHLKKPCGNYILFDWSVSACLCVCVCCFCFQVIYDAFQKHVQNVERRLQTPINSSMSVFETVFSVTASSGFYRTLQANSFDFLLDHFILSLSLALLLALVCIPAIRTPDTDTGEVFFPHYKCAQQNNTMHFTLQCRFQWNYGQKNVDVKKPELMDTMNEQKMKKTPNK